MQQKQLQIYNIVYNKQLFILNKKNKIIKHYFNNFIVNKLRIVKGMIYLFIYLFIFPMIINKLINQINPQI